MPAGHRDEEGNYPEGTVFGAVQKKLKEYLEQSQKLKKEFEEKEEENADR